MSVSRRSVIGGGLGTLGLLATGTLSGCSTSTAPKEATSGSAGTTNLVLWMWPDGFGKEVTSGLKKQFPHYAVRQDIIGGDFKQKLTTSFQAKSGLPDITGVKGEDIAFFRAFPDYFVDLNTLGAEAKKGEYLDWKWRQGMTSDGKLLGFPIDIGPTALFYRHDTFKKAGLPYEPDAVAAAIKTWDEYIEFGKKLHAKLPDTWLIRNGGGMFDTIWKQSGKSFIDEQGVFIGDQAHIKNAWDTVVKAVKAGVVAKLQSNNADSQAAVNAGKLPADFGASWHLADLMNDAPRTKGLWHVCAHPGTPTNNGGSFLTIPKGANDPKKSFEVITWMLNAKNQALEFKDKGNFPSTPASYDMPEVSGEVDFLGGQVASKVFGDAAKTVRPVFEHTQNGAVSAPFFAEMELFENGKKDAQKAWDDAVNAAKRIAKQSGVTVK